MRSKIGNMCKHIIVNNVCSDLRISCRNFGLSSNRMIEETISNASFSVFALLLSPTCRPPYANGRFIFVWVISW